MVAVETEQGFDIEDTAASAASSGAALMGADGQVVGSPPVSLVEGRIYRVDVPESGPRQRSRTVVPRFAAGVSLLALAHHTFDVAATAQTERRRELRRALDSLETDTPLLDNAGGVERYVCGATGLHLAGTFRVSEQAMTIRLATLGLL